MRKVIVTGSSSGIGQAITEYLLESGNEVIGLARDHSKFNPQNEYYKTYPIDFSDINNLESQYKELHKKYIDVDTLILSAGFGRFGELEQFSVQQIRELMDVNFISQVLLIKQFLPQLKKVKGSKIILIGSEAGLSGEKKGSIYCASKFALRGFSQSLRKECAKAGVAVTLINPGIINSPFFKNLDFKPGDQDENALKIDDLVQCIAFILSAKPHCVIEEINLQPIKKILEKVKS